MNKTLWDFLNRTSTRPRPESICSFGSTLQLHPPSENSPPPLGPKKFPRFQLQSGEKVGTGDIFFLYFYFVKLRAICITQQVIEKQSEALYSIPTQEN